LEFERLEKELSNSSVWPPLGKNNDIKVAKHTTNTQFDVELELEDYCRETKNTQVCRVGGGVR